MGNCLVVNLFNIKKPNRIKRDNTANTESPKKVGDVKKTYSGMKAAGSINNKRVIATIALVLVLAIGFNISILVSLNNKNANNTLDVVLNQVVSRLDRNYQEEKRLVSSLKEEYIVKAQSVAYILDQKPELKDDLLELLIIAGKMGIDEIHLFDEEGVIIGGTLPDYYGVSFGDGEQISYFMPMLTNRNLTMCQDVTPNTAEGRNMMYAITWNSTHNYMVQIGIEPKRLLEELKRNELSTVISAMPAYEGIEIFVADKITGDIGGATNKNYIGKNMRSLGIEIADSSMLESKGTSNNRNGYKHFYRYKQWSDYIVLISYSTQKDLGNFFVYMLMMLIYLSLASIVIYVMVGKIARTTKEKNDQFSILVSMSEVYYSMHLIDLEENTVKEYSASEKVREVVNKTDGADEMMRRIISETVYPEYLDAVLEFTDLNTLAERMVGKKIITEEFHGNQFGWCRASFITIEADDEGVPKKVLFVTRDIDKDKQKEEQLIIKSHTDGLTGLFNRRAYEDHTRTYGYTITEDNLVYLSMDVNGLKKVNDTMGHAVGDELLIGAADCMKRCLLSYGRIYRVGGDEFAGIIFATRLELKNVIEDFNREVAAWHGDNLKSLSISIGYVAVSEMEDRSIKAMAKEADRRMYENKEKYYQSLGDTRKYQTGSGDLA